jgi:hypothetical protein
MMSPKAAAHFFTRCSIKHPEPDRHSIHFTQQPDPRPRSGLARSRTKDGIHMKKSLIPAALIGDYQVAGSFFVSYFLTGRFGLYSQYKKYAAPSLPHPFAKAAAQAATSATVRTYGTVPVAYCFVAAPVFHSEAAPVSTTPAVSGPSPVTGPSMSSDLRRSSALVYGPASPAGSAPWPAPGSPPDSGMPPTPPGASGSLSMRIVGSAQTWASYRTQSQSLLRILPLPGSSAPVSKLSPGHPVSQVFGGPDDVAYIPTRKHPYPQRFATAVVTVDRPGRAWLWASASLGFPSHAVGLDSTKLLAPASDPALARQLILVASRPCCTPTAISAKLSPSSSRPGRYSSPSLKVSRSIPTQTLTRSLKNKPVMDLGAPHLAFEVRDKDVG